MDKVSDGFIYLGLALFAGVAWLFRLEGSHKRSVEEVDRLRQEFDAHIDKDAIAHAEMLEKLSDIRSDTSEIKGFLKNQN